MNSKNILGGILGSYEDGFEKETSIVSTMASGVTGVLEVFSSLLSQDIAGIEPKKETRDAGKFPSIGSIDNFKNNKAQIEQLKQQQEQQADQLEIQEKIDRKKAFFRALKEDQERTEKEKEKLLFEEEINDIITNLPTEQKNQLLHYQANYRDRSVYQRAELRKKLIEQKKNSEKQEKAASIPSPAKQPSALEGAFEGRSGSQGSGSANLSNQAVG